MTNNEIIMRLELLKRLGDVRGGLGWYVFRNMKILSDACAEAVKIRNDAIVKYGVEEKTGEYRIDQACDGWDAYVAEVDPVMQIEQDVKLRKMSSEEFDRLAQNADLSATELMILDEVIVEDKHE